MTDHPDPLLSRLLDAPEDAFQRLILADWLEERGTPDDDTRALILRRQADYVSARTDVARRDVVRRLPPWRKWRRLVGPLARVHDEGLSPLVLRVHLPAFLLADHLGPSDALPAGSSFTGTRTGDEYRGGVPTPFRVIARRGGRFAGLIGAAAQAVAGVVVDSRLVFASEDGKPVLYEVSVLSSGNLSGDWRAATGEKAGLLRLRLDSAPEPTTLEERA